MNFTAIKETCIYSSDLERMKMFYADKLGLPIIAHLNGKHIFFRAGRSVLLCFNPEDSSAKKSPPPHYATGKIHFALEVPESEYKNALDECRRLGIKITEEITWPGGKKSFYFEDPEGNVLEIVPDVGIWD